MAKLVLATTFCDRYFEPGSAPKRDALEEWVMEKGTGTKIGDELYIWDNALFGDAMRKPHKLTGLDLVRK